MFKISGTIIDERVRTFAESVRKGIHGFKPGETWWIVKHTSESRADKYYSSAVTFCEQLGISEEDMDKHLKNSRWYFYTLCIHITINILIEIFR
jgi:hypothetical protein